MIAMAIGMQNMPEGLAVVSPLLREGCSRGKALSYGTLTGLVEPIGVCWEPAWSPSFSWFFLGDLLFAAGAMLFVIGDEMIPEGHRKGFEREATFGLIAGFVIMMLLDCLFA